MRLGVIEPSPKSFSRGVISGPNLPLSFNAARASFLMFLSHSKN
jgi:hypothetical protein